MTSRTDHAIDRPLRIAITGGAGYIGRSTVRRLLEAGHDVRVLDVVTHEELPEEAEVREIDVLDSQALAEALDDRDAVVHLAGLVAGDANSEPAEAERINERGTAAVLEACRRAEVHHVVFASTFLVYTGADDDTMDEDCAIEADRLKPFSRSKLLGEELIQEWASDDANSYVTLRIGSVYGPGGGTNVIRTFVEDAIAGEEVEVWGMGRRMRPLIYVGDVASALERAVSHLCAGGASGLFNCVGPQAHSTRDILEGLQRILPAMRVTYRTEKPEPVGDVCPSTAKARRVLAWQATTDLQTGLEKTVEWFRRQRAGLMAAGGNEGE